MGTNKIDKMVRIERFVFLIVPILFFTMVGIYSLSQLISFGYNAQLPFDSPQEADYYLHFRTILLYSLIALYALRIFGRSLTPKETSFYAMCILFINLAYFEMVFGVLNTQPMIRYGLLGQHIKNAVFDCVYASFTIPLMVLSDRLKPEKITKKEAACAIFVYAALWLIYFIVNIREILTGHRPQALEDLRSLIYIPNMFFARIVVFLPKVWLAICSFKYLSKYRC